MSPEVLPTPPKAAPVTWWPGRAEGASGEKVGQCHTHPSCAQGSHPLRPPTATPGTPAVALQVATSATCHTLNK